MIYTLCLGCAVLYVYDSEKKEMPSAVIPVNVDGTDWVSVEASLRVRGKKAPLFFLYRGSGAVDLYSFTLY